MPENKLLSPVNPVKHSIDRTLRTIERRTRHYRNTIIVVVAIVAIAAIVSIVTFSWQPLCAIFLLPAVVVTFIYLDCRVIKIWSDELLDLWKKNELDLELYIKSITMMKMIPKSTLNGMLKLLPVQCAVKKEDAVIRAVIAATLSSISSSHLLNSTVSLCVGIAVPISIAISLVTFSLWPLPGTLVGVLAVAAKPFFERKLWHRWQTTVSGINEKLDNETVEKALQTLPWETISPKQKQQIFKFLFTLPS
ncbi:MAG: hypothetical protein GX639_08050 [Fibrobacter sp.]|nr:hypothetical protein [Fibrobacter sp.]